MLETFNTAIQGILKLLKLQKDAKKLDLETQKLAREEKQARSLIKIATDEDIRKYDPRVAAIDQMLTRRDQQHRKATSRSPIGSLLLIGFVVALVGIVTWLFRKLLN